jgi:hypothetical protein
MVLKNWQLVILGFGSKLTRSFRSFFTAVEARYNCTGIAERAFDMRETAEKISSLFLRV